MKRSRSQTSFIDYKSVFAFVVRSCFVKKGDCLKFGQNLFDCKEKGIIKVDSSLDGAVVKECYLKAGQSVELGDVLFVYFFCEHSLIVHGLCTSCGVDCSDVSKKHVTMLPSQPSILFARDVAQEMSAKTSNRLALANKLTLILDLDLTLLHATSDKRHEQVLARAPNEDLNEVHSFYLNGVKSLVKLRPGIRDFLEQLHEKFELHIYTHGRKEYGHKIASILDPTGCYFAAQEGVGEKRITTMDDAYGDHERAEKEQKKLRDYKSLKRLFPVAQDHVLVLDDNYVWGNCPNVIRVIPYFFWGFLPPEDVGMFEVNAETKVETPLSLLYFSEAAQERHLEELLNLLNAIHSKFYSVPKSHTATAFSEVRREILRGCTVVFSGIFSSNGEREAQPLWRLAESYGCTCSEVVEDATHVVAAQEGTKKVKSALQSGIHVVNVDWLVDSIRHFKRMNEDWYRQLPVERFVDKRSMALMEELCSAYLANIEEEEQQEKEEEEEIDLEALEKMIKGESSNEEYEDEDDDGRENDFF